MSREIYNYYKAVKQDIKDFLKENCFVYCGDVDDFICEVEDIIEMSDDVTGNESGSYTMSAIEAENCIYGNIGLLYQALSECGYDINVLNKGAETLDVIIRCFVASEVMRDSVIDFLEDEYGVDC